MCECVCECVCVSVCLCVCVSMANRGQVFWGAGLDYGLVLGAEPGWTSLVTLALFYSLEFTLSP